MQLRAGDAFSVSCGIECCYNFSAGAPDGYGNRTESDFVLISD